VQSLKLKVQSHSIKPKSFNPPAAGKNRENDNNGRAETPFLKKR
jgi:hypothetical protein